MNDNNITFSIKKINKKKSILQILMLICSILLFILAYEIEDYSVFIEEDSYLKNWLSFGITIAILLIAKYYERRLPTLNNMGKVEFIDQSIQYQNKKIELKDIKQVTIKYKKYHKTNYSSGSPVVIYGAGNKIIIKTNNNEQIKINIYLENKSDLQLLVDFSRLLMKNNIKVLFYKKNKKININQ